ncbi:MAG: hypothetical protein IPI46_08265 [Bacteroidetes bacterium]|nr:hypothetical protein [Bacteroidota bacterium]
MNICSSVLNLKLFLQGYYTGSSTMTSTLLNQGMSGSSTVTDTVLVQLRNTTAPYAVVASTKAVLSTSGNAVCTFTPAVSGTYYIAVHHRNSVQTWSNSGC